MDNGKSIDFVAMLRNVAAAGSIYLFLGGFLYRSFRNQNLGVPQDNGASLPIYVVYAFSVFAYDEHLLARRHDILFVAALCLATVVAVLVLLYTTAGGVTSRERLLFEMRRLWNPRLTIASTLIIGCWLFILMSQLASAAADESALETRLYALSLNTSSVSSYRSDRVVFRPDVAKNYNAIAPINDMHRLLIVERTSDFIFVLYQPALHNSTDLPSARALGIPVADILYIDSNVPGWTLDFHLNG